MLICHLKEIMSGELQILQGEVIAIFFFSVRNYILILRCETKSYHKTGIFLHKTDKMFWRMI